MNYMQQAGPAEELAGQALKALNSMKCRRCLHSLCQCAPARVVGCQTLLRGKTSRVPKQWTAIHLGMVWSTCILFV